MVEGSPPTQTIFRTHSSIAAVAIKYGSSASAVASPLPIARPLDDPRTGVMTAASDGALPKGPQNGRIQRG